MTDEQKDYLRALANLISRLLRREQQWERQGAK